MKKAADRDIAWSAAFEVGGAGGNWTRVRSGFSWTSPSAVCVACCSVPGVMQTSTW